MTALKEGTFMIDVLLDLRFEVFFFSKLGVGEGETGRKLQYGESNSHQQSGNSGS